MLHLCESKVGRETLRIKNIYALLREFDRASSSSLLSVKKKEDSMITSPMISNNVDNITNNHSQSGIDDSKDMQVVSTVHNIQELSIECDNMQNMEFMNENENLIYIDGQNCSTLHALIGLLIQD
uniref:Bm9373 n=1 Tax=Brugia malayi TaxID=6279 RepID=A0A1I9GAN9_BRUMA|nr:Bm9373 [Brugia malayi]